MIVDDRKLRFWSVGLADFWTGKLLPTYEQKSLEIVRRVESQP
jgi:hypothetical protein